MNGYYKMQTFEQLQRMRLFPRAAQAGKGVLFQPGYIAAADAELCGNLLLRLRDGAIQSVSELVMGLGGGGNLGEDDRYTSELLVSAINQALEQAQNPSSAES